MSLLQKVYSSLKKAIIMVALFLSYNAPLKAPVDLNNPQSVKDLIAALEALKDNKATDAQRKLINELQQPNNTMLQNIPNLRDIVTQMTNGVDVQTDILGNDVIKKLLMFGGLSFIALPVASHIATRTASWVCDVGLDIFNMATESFFEGVTNWLFPNKEDEKTGLITPIPRSALKKFPLENYVVSKEFGESLSDLIAIIQGAMRFKKKGLKPILLYGPAGTGKTLLMNTIANTCKAKDVKALELTKIISDTANYPDPGNFIQRFFTEAKENKTFVIIDEAEAVMMDRGKLAEGGLDINAKRKIDAITNLLKILEDYGRFKYQGIVILATNFEGLIDDAIRSRFLPFLVPPSSKESLLDVMNRDVKTWNKLGAKYSINSEEMKKACAALEAVEATGRDAEAIIMQTMLVCVGAKTLQGKLKRDTNPDKSFKDAVEKRIRGQCMVTFNKKYAKEYNDGKNILSKDWSIEQIADVARNFKESLELANADMLTKFKQDKIALKTAAHAERLSGQVFATTQALATKPGLLRQPSTDLNQTPASAQDLSDLQTMVGKFTGITGGYQAPAA